MDCQCKDITNCMDEPKTAIEAKCNQIYIHFFAVRKQGKIIIVDHMTNRKRRENLCDMLQRLTKLNKFDACVEGRVEVKDVQ